MNTTGWLKGLRVTADGTGIVSHAGVALIRALADNIGLTGGLSRALASDRLLVHDRGRVKADLACAIADGAENTLSCTASNPSEANIGQRVVGHPRRGRDHPQRGHGGALARRRRAWTANCPGSSAGSINVVFGATGSTPGSNSPCPGSPSNARARSTSKPSSAFGMR